MPQLGRGLSVTAAIRYFQIISRRKSRDSCFRLRVLLTSEPKSCRNSRENCLLLQRLCLRIASRRNSRQSCFILRTHPAFESHYAATRAKTFSYKGHFLPSTSNSQRHAATRAKTVSSCRDSACESHHAATRVEKYSLLVRYPISSLHFQMTSRHKPRKEYPFCVRSAAGTVFN